jgi:beta-glucanase (GH16 family)
MNGAFITGSVRCCLALQLLLHIPRHASAQVLADPPEHHLIGIEAADFCEHAPWQLVFEEEFNGGTLDADRWVTFYPFCSVQDECDASRSGFPDHIAISTDSNVTMTGQGTVKITARSGPLTTWYGNSTVYTAGVLFSRQKFGRGRFESRIKVPKSTSNYLWPAFWLFGGGPWCSEIDILEILWRPSNSFHHSLHRYDYECKANYANDEAGHEFPELSDDFHIFRVDWDKWFVNYYVDNALIYRACRIYDLQNKSVSSCEIPGGIYLQNQAFPGQDDELSIILNISIHKRWDDFHLGNGPPIPDLPAVMEVDYVRVYERAP